MNGVETRQLKGFVKVLHLSGWLENSALLEFVIDPEDNPSQLETLLVDSKAEPQKFAAATTILTLAYQTQKRVQVTIPTGQPPNEPKRISAVKIPG